MFEGYERTSRENSMRRKDFPSSPLGLHRVIEPAGALPQAAWRLDPSPELWPDEARVRVDRLNLDAASFRQLSGAAAGSSNGGGTDLAAALRAAVLGIVAERGKMQNPVTGSGGMLTGVVEEVGPDSPLGLAPGDRIATLVSLSLTPLAITDGLARWDGRSEQDRVTVARDLLGTAARSPPCSPMTCRSRSRSRCTTYA